MTNRATCSVSLILLGAYFSSDIATADSPVVVPIRLLQNFPVLSADIGGIAVPLQFDSGNSGTVALTQTILDQVKAVPTGEFSQGIDGIPPGFGGFIGYNFFARHVVCLDFTKNQVLIQR